MSTGNVEDKKKLRQGSFVAVFIVTALYMLATAGYVRIRSTTIQPAAANFDKFCVLTYHDIEKQEGSGGDLSIVTQFAHEVSSPYSCLVLSSTDSRTKAFGSSAGIAICISLSAVGNLIAVIYTYSRVKQSMAIQNFLPFSNLLKRNKDHPIGGIVVHWIVTVATIIALPNDADGYGFVVGMFSYGHTIIAGKGPDGMNSNTYVNHSANFTKSSQVWGLSGSALRLTAQNGSDTLINGKPISAGGTTSTIASPLHSSSFYST